MNLFFLRKNGLFDFLLLDFISFLATKDQWKKFDLGYILITCSENFFYYVFIISIIILKNYEEKIRKVLNKRNMDNFIFKISLIIVNILTMIDMEYFQIQTMKMINLLYFICNYNLLRKGLSKYFSF